MSIFMDVGEVSRLLNIRPSTVYYLSKRGEIPSMKIGKHLRFHKGQIERWLRKRMISQNQVPSMDPGSRGQANHLAV